MCRDSLLFRPLLGPLLGPVPRERESWTIARSLAEFREHYRAAASAGELRELFRARCVFAAGDPEIGARFEDARREILTRDAARDTLIAERREPRAISRWTEPRSEVGRSIPGGVLTVPCTRHERYLSA